MSESYFETSELTVVIDHPAEAVPSEEQVANELQTSDEATDTLAPSDLLSGFPIGKEHQRWTLLVQD